LSCFYDGLECVNADIKRLICALVKSSIKKQAKRTDGMSITPLTDYFSKQPYNKLLNLKQLSRLKVITLLSLTIMIRLADIAPRADLCDTANNSTYPSTMSRDNVIIQLPLHSPPEI